ALTEGLCSAVLDGLHDWSGRLALEVQARVAAERRLGDRVPLDAGRWPERRALTEARLVAIGAVVGGDAVEDIAPLPAGACHGVIVDDVRRRAGLGAGARRA